MAAAATTAAWTLWLSLDPPVVSFSLLDLVLGPFAVLWGCFWFELWRVIAIYVEIIDIDGPASC